MSFEGSQSQQHLSAKMGNPQTQMSNSLANFIMNDN